MAYPPREQFPGAIYHVTSRGNNRGAIYRTEADRETWLRILRDVVRETNVECHAYCQLTNHFHLCLSTPEPNVARAMQILNSRYAREFNRRHGRRGHVFERRYFSALIEKQEHLLEVARYVVLNPERAGLADVGEWRWSSFRATAGLIPAPRFLTTRWILGQFSPSPQRARALYADFVAAGSPAVSVDGLLLAA